MERKEYNVCDVVYIIDKETPTKACDIYKGGVTNYIITEHVILEKIVTESAKGLDYTKDNHRYFVTHSTKNIRVEYKLNDSNILWSAIAFYDSNIEAINHIKSNLVPIKKKVINKHGITADIR